MIPVKLPIKRKEKIRTLNTSEEQLSNKNLKSYLTAYKRSQESFIKIYGLPSVYLEKHKFYVEWYYKNLEYFTEKESYTIGYSIFCRDIIGERFPYKTVEKIKALETKSTFDESIRSKKSIYTEEVDDFKFDSSVIKSDWCFNYDPIQLEVCGKWSKLLNSFNKNLVVPYNFKGVSPEDRSNLILLLSKLFPSTYMLSMNKFFVPIVYNKLSEVGVIKSTDVYKCLINKGTIYNKSSFKGKGKPFTKAPCKKLFGKKRIDFLNSNSCHLNCAYYLDRMKASRSRNTIMRPFTFFKQTNFSEGGSKIFKPRSLMIIDNIEALYNSLKNFFSFTVDAALCKKINFKSNKGMYSLYEKIRNEVKVFEQKGWTKMMQEMRSIPASYDSYPCGIGPFELEDDFTVYRHIENRNSVEGLNNKELMQVFKLKEIIFKIKLAFKAQGRYTINKSRKIYKFTPNSVEHLLKRFITYYGRYFLIMNINYADEYVSDFRSTL